MIRLTICSKWQVLHVWAGNSPSKSFESEKIREIKTEELRGREMTDSQRLQISNEGIYKTLPERRNWLATLFFLCIDFHSRV